MLALKIALVALAVGLWFYFLLPDRFASWRPRGRL